jgi:DNA-binding XRE family transcriptional regulator
MKAKNNKADISTWAEIKDRVYGEKGTERRDNLERESESFKIGLLLKKARESRNMTQEELAQIIDKKRTYISRVENNGSNITLSTLFDIVEKGLGGKVNISIDI